ncbi:hypothetical protein L7G72_20935 [Xenorhabdus bovienii]|uniref:hypothetical protein n=1 Tax=Xenorhabdus bovienii TaxID=40576 RepID=UPI001EDDF185|nr:hypothetical protein [Xenorhabdus bovienii]MCG3464212.1 hypothetical protein [Xenorhabdus bovienii]
MLNNTNVFNKLESFISYVEGSESKQGLELYKEALDFFSRNNFSDEEVTRLYRSFCGYLAHGEFTQPEYNMVLEIIEILKNEMN